MKEKKKETVLKKVTAAVFFFILVIFIVPFVKKEEKTKNIIKPEEETKLREIMNVDAISVFSPGSEIEQDKFYLVRNEWGYLFIQFKDAGVDGDLDLVSYSHSEVPFDPDAFDPDTGFPGNDFITSNPTSDDWDQWRKRFKQVLKDYTEGLRRKRQRRK
jgi:hypothetical protein